MTTATVVVESAAKGGGLITASMATGYEHEVFAFPGRVSDEFSEGCNAMILSREAEIALSAESIAASLGWETRKDGKRRPKREPELFPELNVDEQKVVDALRGGDDKQVNALALETGISIAKLMPMLFDMEMRGILRSLSGARYRLCM